MRMIYTFVLTLVLIVHSSECSSQSAKNPYGECDPGPSFSSAENLFLLAECSSQSERNPNCEDNPGRARSRSPPGTHASVTLLGYSLENLGYLRLRPCTNESIQFEFRKYCFPVGKPIRLRAAQNRWVPVPTREQIVFSLSNGDVFAILEYTGILLGIYRGDKNHSRVKINMISGEVDNLTADEIRYCPVGKKQPISVKNFIKTPANNDSLQSVWNPHSEPQDSLIRFTTRSFPGRPPSGQVLGFAMEELGYVRLIPCTNQNQRFEFRRYFFPENRRIRIRINRVNYSFEPNQEYMVLSTSDGDVLAIMDQSDTLRGIYRTDDNRSRIKLNMISEEVINLTADEIRDCPVGKYNPISPINFIRAFADHDSLRFTWKPHSEGIPAPLNRHSSPPGKPPSQEVLGYSLKKLGYIRLIPQANQNRRFEFRRYVIPANKPIRLLSANGSYVPVPVREYIVLSTSEGDVFAILEYTEILRGLYSTRTKRPRIKMNMISGKVENMTASELEECRVGMRNPIFPRYFREEVSNEDSLQHVYH